MPSSQPIAFSQVNSSSIAQHVRCKLSIVVFLVMRAGALISAVTLGVLPSLFWLSPKLAKDIINKVIKEVAHFVQELGDPIVAQICAELISKYPISKHECHQLVDPLIQNATPLISQNATHVIEGYQPEVRNGLAVLLVSAFITGVGIYFLLNSSVSGVQCLCECRSKKDKSSDSSLHTSDGPLVYVDTDSDVALVRTVTDQTCRYGAFTPSF